MPGKVARAETEPTTRASAARLAALVTGAWTVLDEVVVTAPAELRKGPRGGGRDRDKIVAHVLEAETSYARMIGNRLQPPAIDDVDAIEAQREAIATALAIPSPGPVDKGWPVRYAARRIAWHVVDHAWEIQDKSS